MATVRHIGVVRGSRGTIQFQFLRDWVPKFRGTSFISPKGTFLRGMTRFKPSCSRSHAPCCVVPLCIGYTQAFPTCENLGSPSSRITQTSQQKARTPCPSCTTTWSDRKHSAIVTRVGCKPRPTVRRFA